MEINHVHKYCYISQKIHRSTLKPFVMHQFEANVLRRSKNQNDLPIFIIFMSNPVRSGFQNGAELDVNLSLIRTLTLHIACFAQHCIKHQLMTAPHFSY